MTLVENATTASDGGVDRFTKMKVFQPPRGRVELDAVVVAQSR